METKMLMIAIVCAAAAGFAVLGQAVKAEAAVAAEPAKILIAYYSYSGNTKAVAEQIQKATGGEIFEIKPAKAYPASYNECVDQAKKECGEGFKPQLAGALPDVSKYDVVFVGTPNWWGTMAPPVLSFLSARNFAGKTVIPFMTHGGGGVQRCEADICKAAPKAAFGKIGVFSGNGGSSVAGWIKEVVTVKR